MKKTNQLSEAAFQLDGKMPLKQAIPLLCLIPYPTGRLPWVVSSPLWW